MSQAGGANGGGGAAAGPLAAAPAAAAAAGQVAAPVTPVNARALWTWLGKQSRTCTLKNFDPPTTPF